MDILDLDMSILTEQYIQYLNEMDQYQLEVVGDYMSELATLMEIKSKTMLPKTEVEFEDTYEEDPRARLVARLLEYQQYKEVSASLSEFFYTRSLQQSKPLSHCVDQWIQENEQAPFEGDVYDLVKAMNRVLRRMSLVKALPITMTTKELSTQDRVLQIKSRLLDLGPTFSFETLCNDCTNVQEVIVTFLAVLDMAKLHELNFQVDDHGTIWFGRGSAL